MAKAGAFPWEAWKRYAKLQADIQQAAADKMAGYIEEFGLKDRTGAMQYAYWAIGEKYGPAAAEAACEMYDLTARLAGVSVPPAEPAEMPTPEQVTRFVEKAAAQSDANIPAAVGNMVKRAGADTTLKNAARDGAEWAWVPVGDTCAFCRMLASNGWQRQSKKAQARHAEHIHNHCDCQYAVRFNGQGGPAGYDPAKFQREYYDAEGENWQEKLNTMRRADYAENADAINAQKRAAYAARKEREGLTGSGGGGNMNREQKTIRLPDVEIGRSLGARAKNYDIMQLETGEHFSLMEGSHLQNVTVFAGKGTGTPYRNAERLAKKYGGDPEDWQHVKGTGTVDYYGEERKANLHWSRCVGVGDVDFFVKEWLE